MQIKDLKHNKRNPRKISDKQLKALQKSINKFGDLSGFIFNKSTKQLVSGHQRSKTLPENSKIIREIKHDAPTNCGTVAEGYVQIGDERFKYREVEWDEKTEMEALLAANKHGGEWDNDLLKLAFTDFPDLDVEVSGFDMPELESLGIELDAIVTESEKSDAQHIKENPGPEAKAEKEIIGEGLYDKPKEKEPEPAEVFEKTEEKTDIVGKRFVIIIDCKDADHKASLKKTLQPLVEEAEGKFF